MKKRVACWLMGMVCVWSGAAHAATVLMTPPYYSATGVATCSVVNVSKKAVTVTIEVMNYDGTALKAETTSLNSGILDAITNGGVWCRFTIANGSAKSVRAGILVYDGASGVSASFPAN
ncbi:MAG TPA: hypothetical protein VMR50_10655 [Myxococcota bacterium]|nr:hypothetical protein [Myxococcota bacterium]